MVYMSNSATCIIETRELPTANVSSSTGGERLRFLDFLLDPMRNQGQGHVRTLRTMIVVWYGCDGIDGTALIKAIAFHELSHNTGCIGNEYLWCDQKDATNDYTG